jgi:pectin methylesterase-like acyl-CoA thioesterase
MKILPIAIVALFLFAVVPPSTFAAGSKSKGSKKTSPVTDTSDRISAIHLMSITINIYATQSAKEYRVTPATKITVNGQPSQLSGLATGMDVVVTPAADGVTAASIDAKSPKR